MRDNRLVIQGVTDDQIRAMPTWDARASGTKELEGSQNVALAAGQ